MLHYGFNEGIDIAYIVQLIGFKKKYFLHGEIVFFSGNVDSNLIQGGKAYLHPK